MQHQRSEFSKKSIKVHLSRQKAPGLSSFPLTNREKSKDSVDSPLNGENNQIYNKPCSLIANLRSQLGNLKQQVAKLSKRPSRGQDNLEKGGPSPQLHLQKKNSYTYFFDGVRSTQQIESPLKILKEEHQKMKKELKLLIEQNQFLKKQVNCLREKQRNSEENKQIFDQNSKLLQENKLLKEEKENLTQSLKIFNEKQDLLTMENIQIKIQYDSLLFEFQKQRKEIQKHLKSTKSSSMKNPIVFNEQMSDKQLKQIIKIQQKTLQNYQNDLNFLQSEIKKLNQYRQLSKNQSKVIEEQNQKFLLSKMKKLNEKFKNK